MFEFFKKCMWVDVVNLFIHYTELDFMNWFGWNIVFKAWNKEQSWLIWNNCNEIVKRCMKSCTKSCMKSCTKSCTKRFMKSFTKSCKNECILKHIPHQLSFLTSWLVEILNIYFSIHMSCYQIILSVCILFHVFSIDFRNFGC